VNHDEGAARCQRVACKVEGAAVYAVVCGYGRLVRVCSHHVERDFGLGYQFVPKVDGERRVRAGEYSYEVAFERLYCPLCFIGSFVIRGNALVLDSASSEVQL
jgi:hypothetical protein